MYFACRRPGFYPQYSMVPWTLERSLSIELGAGSKYQWVWHNNSHKNIDFNGVRLTRIEHKRVTHYCYTRNAIKQNSSVILQIQRSRIPLGLFGLCLDLQQVLFGIYRLCFFAKDLGVVVYMQQYSGFIPNSVLMDHSWWCSYMS